jgi:peptide/nickel transport system ATP-binding protein
VTDVGDQRHLMPGPVLTVTGLSVTARHGERDRTLVRDVSFALNAGQAVGIVGESGSGKTMTARSVLGLLPSGVRARGEITFAGIDLVGASERALRAVRGRRIGLLLQDPFTMLNPLQSAGTHIAESLPRQLRKSRSQARSEVRRRLAEVGLDPGLVARRYPFQLSGGMRQRVALAAAIASDPELLIADEPTTALDVTTQDEVLRLLGDLQRRRGMALLLITHDLRVAFSVCDQVLVMYGGSIMEDAPAGELMAAPEHPYTLGLLLAEPPVSHLVGSLNAIPGNVPSADEVEHTCAFATRCAWQQQQCVAARPALDDAGGSRSTACLRIAEIRGQLRQRRAQLELAVSPPVPPAGRPVAAISELRKTYRTIGMLGRPQTAAALRGVSFHIAEGESVGLVGETGSGKTTIARCMLGLESPDSGSIKVWDVDVTSYRRLTRADRRRVRRLVQAVFQDPYTSLNPALAVGTTLREALRIRGVTNLDMEVRQLLSLVGLPAPYARLRPAALSGGERQRAAIARALALQPRLLICDEPVASLDVSVQAQVLELLRDIRRQLAMSMLFITHDLSVVRQMTDRVIVLRGGEIVEIGDTPSVLDSPKHPYTIRLLESLPGTGPGSGVTNAGQVAQAGPRAATADDAR